MPEIVYFFQFGVAVIFFLFLIVACDDKCCGYPVHGREDCTGMCQICVEYFPARGSITVLRIITNNFSPYWLSDIHIFNNNQ